MKIVDAHTGRKAQFEMILAVASDNIPTWSSDKDSHCTLRTV